MEEKTETSPEKEARRARARDYWDTDLEKQREWYSKRASQHKTIAHRLGLLVIASGALIAFVAALKPAGIDKFDVAIAALGVLVAVSQGIIRIWRYDETWIEYRKASERMKREQRLYVNACGAYAAIEDEDARYKAFVEATEAIIAEEQQLYFEKSAAQREDTNQT